MRPVRRRFLVLALAVFAWLAGASQHAAMGIRHALSAGLESICSVDGPKQRHTGNVPGVPVKPAAAGGDCQVCAHFCAPAVAHSGETIVVTEVAPAIAGIKFAAVHKRHSERRSARAPPPVA